MSSMLNKTATKPKAPGSAYVLTITAGLLLTFAVAGALALLREDKRLLSFVIFAAAIAGPIISMCWLVFVSHHTVVRDRNADENVETKWITTASAGASLDVVLAAVITLLATEVLNVELSGTVVLIGVVALTLVDTAVRYLVVKRRES